LPHPFQTSSENIIAGSGIYNAERFEDSELPEQVDLRPFMSPVENQASANSCTANAVVGGYEYIMGRVGKSVDFSRLFVYYNARLLGLQYSGDNQIKDQGSSITLALKMLEEKGVCYESTWPYHVRENGQVKSINDEPYPDAYEEADSLLDRPKFQWETPEQVPIELHSMKHCLAEGYPFIFGLRLFKSFDQAGVKGRVPMPDLSSDAGRESHGNHAMLCVGYKNAAQMFIVRNSWGEDWGDEGYCYIPYDYMTNPDLCFDCWKIKGTTDVDLTEDVWHDDEDFDEDFYEEVELPDSCYLEDTEAIAVLCLCGAQVDGISDEEAELLVELYESYEIDALQEKIQTLLDAGGYHMLYNAAVQVVLSEDCVKEAVQMSAEFAAADEVISDEEYEYWAQLATDLEIDEDKATKWFNRILEDYEMDTIDSLFE
jgi:C1A family cysteine protease